MSFSALRPELRATIVAIPLAGLVAAVVEAIATGGLVSPSPWRWALAPGCLVAIVLAERFPVKIGVQQKVSLAALPCIVAALLLPPGVGPLTAGAGALAGNRFAGRSRWEAAFNAGNVLLAASVAAAIGAMGSQPSPITDARALAAAAAYTVVNLTVAVIAPALNTRRSYMELLGNAVGASWPAQVALAASAVVFCVLAITAPVISPLPLVVLPLVYRMNRAIEAQATANAQLEKVLAAQRRFLTDVSHQVATPLATIMTNLSILRRQRRLDHDEAIADSVVEADRMKRMLGRLRALAHADEDVPLRRELVDLAELTADVVRAFAEQARTSGVAFVTEVESHASVSADKDLLREAVGNLVDNAVRVSPPGAAVRLRVAQGAGGPFIDVIDSGPGIDGDRLATIFERFQRSDSGSGLGLAIARRVVERHGGSLRVKTHPGDGSTFRIELPASN